MTNLFNRLILLLAVFILGTSSIYAQCILFPGNLVFTGVNLEDDGIDGATQNDRFSFVLLQNVNENFEIHFTDLGWTTSNSFQTKDRALTDGVIRWTAPVGGVVAGTQITIDAKYNLSATLGTVTGVRATPNDANIYLNLGNSGDQLFAFTGTIENPAFIAGINLNQNWTTLLTDKLTSSESALPASLSVANVQNVSLVSEFPNGFTNSVISGSIFNGQFSDIVAVFNQNANWSFDETYLPDAIPTGFQLPKALTFSITPFNFLNTPTGTSTITYGANTQFTVSKVDSRNITSYQWQVSTNNDADYSNLSDVGIYSGTNTATLVISKPQVEDSNNRYRAVAVDACGNEATSNHLTLTVNPKSLTASLIGTVEKERDGNTQATIANENLELTGQLTGDDVAVVNPGEGTYASALPGTNIQVTVTGLSITGADVLNYSLSSTSASANVGTIVDTTPPLVLGFELDNTSLSVGETTTVTVTFSEEVTGLTSTAFTVPNGVLSGLSSSDGGVTWTVTFTPNDGVEDVTNIISLANLGFADLTGNTGTGTTNSNNYSIDTQRPTATIVVSDTQLRAGETSLVTFTFSEAVAGFTNADLSVVNGILSSVSSSDGGITWTATLTPT
ncbi:Ig-like domain-containing protein, partial [Belliella aquatica]